MAGSVAEVQPDPQGETIHAIVQTTASVSASILWKEAIEKFRKDNNVDLSKTLGKDWNLAKAGDGLEKAKQMFENARHLEGDKKDNLIKSIGGCLTWMGSASDFISENASGNYGTPFKFIFGGISYFIKAAIEMKNDFDLIEETFESIHDALEDFSLLGVTPRERNIFTDRLIDVFIAFFKFCWFSTRLLKDYSRKRLYIGVLLKGSNPKIKAQCFDVTRKIKQFRATITFKTLDAIEATRKDMNEKLDDMPQRLVQAIQDGKLKPSDFNQFFWANQNTSGKIKEIFKKHGFNLEGISSMENRMNTFKSQFVPDTFSWLENNKEYQAWLKVRVGAIPLIHISGSAGAGKSFFTYNCHRKILEMKAFNHAKPTLNKVQQKISTACFFFEPGKIDSQLSHNVLASVIIQIAEQDAKFGDLASKELEKRLGEMPRATTTGNNDLTTYLWTQVIVRGFDRASAETSRIVYILLDGIELMDPEILNLFQSLNCEKIGIQVMVTHIPNDQIVPTVDLDNRETAALKDDLDKVIDFRISKSINMKGFSEPSLGDIKRKLISKFQEIKKGAMLSVDLVLSVMEQHGDEKFAVEKSASAGPKENKLLYEEMVEMGLFGSGRSQLGRENIKKLYAWCTYANEPLSADQLQYILSLDKSFKESKFNVKSEIQGKSSSILYMTRKELVSTDLSNITIINKIPDKEYQEYVSFKNPAIKEHLAINNSQISERSEDARVEIFLTLCDLLCNRKGDSGIISAESKMLLQWYAARYLIQHFKDIDVEKTSPEQNLKLFESLVRIISNENGVSNMFEGLVKTERLNLKESYIETSLYSDLECLLCADSEDYGARRLVLLTAKVNIHKDKLMQKERRWQSAMLSSRPENLVKKLIQGHMESLARGSTFEDAEVPFKLIYRALYPTGLFKNHDSEKNSISIDQTNERMDTEKEFTANVADKILKYAQENGFSHPAKLSRVRTAIAILLLEKGSGIKERKKVKEYYEANLKHPGTSGPERFYSLLGLANYHSMSTMNDDNKNAECIKQSWENVKYFADQAITEKDIQKGPLGSKLNSERCYEAYLLKACALGELNDIPGAIESCKTALHLGMEYAPVMVHVLNKIVEFYTKTKQFDKLFDEVYQQSPLLKYMWLWDFRYYYFANNSDPMRKAAVLTRRVESLIQLYEEAIGFWLRKEEFQIVAILQYELSYIYRRDARVTKMAESTLNSLIDEVLRDTDKMKGGILQLAFPEMVDTLYEIYSRASTDHESSIKVDIIRRLEKLIENLKRTAVVNPITLSAAIITLAKMLKSSGGNDLKAAKFHAEQAFNLCIADLEDSIESNDGDALYLLARILMFAGLQEKARVAISLYFSKVDEYNENEDDFIDEKDDSYSVSEHSANYTYDLTGSMENGNYISAPPTNIPITDSPGNGMASPMADSQASISEYNSDQESDATSFDTEKDEAADLPRKSPESIRLMDHLQDSPKITNSDGQQDMDLKPIPHLDEKPKIPETDLKATRPNPPLEQNGADWKRDHNDEIPPVEKTSPPPAEPIDPNTNPMSDESQLANGTESNEIDEDLRGDDEINCNGPCETPKLKKWSYAPNAEPWYHCLDCKSVDLCSTCYDTQLKYFQGQGEGFWFKSCWAEHEFIKMPIENWRGVKNGVIRIGERRQLPWKDWIASVKKDWKTQLDKILVVD